MEKKPGHFYIWITGNVLPKRNTPYLISRDLLAVTNTLKRKQKKPVLIVDQSNPSKIALSLASALQIQTVSFGEVRQSEVDEFAQSGSLKDKVALADSVIYYDLDGEDALYESIMDLNPANIMCRGYVPSTEPVETRTTDADPYAFWHTVLYENYQPKKLPYKGIRILQQIDLRPPVWLPGVKRSY